MNQEYSEELLQAIEEYKAANDSFLRFKEKNKALFDENKEHRNTLKLLKNEILQHMEDDMRNFVEIEGLEFELKERTKVAHDDSALENLFEDDEARQKFTESKAAIAQVRKDVSVRKQKKRKVEE